MTVQLIAWTHFDVGSVEDGTGWVPEEWHSQDSNNGAWLSEFAGRACYASFSKPNPTTATNEGYMAHILEVGHESVLEHAVATVYITNVSRAFSHEMIRHRHISPSQLSQRFVNLVGPNGPTSDDFVVPPLFEGDEGAVEILHEVWKTAVDAYQRLVEMYDASLSPAPAQTITGRRKTIREAARAVLPNMTPTALVLTGNHRAWRHFINLRAQYVADAEMRHVAVDLFHVFKRAFPALYQDMRAVMGGQGIYVETVR
jgi:thymidylate synthase (FAD)